MSNDTRFSLTSEGERALRARLAARERERIAIRRIERRVRRIVLPLWKKLLSLAALAAIPTAVVFIQADNDLAAFLCACFTGTVFVATALEESR